MKGVGGKAGIVVSDVEKTYYGKFLQNEEKIRSLATADPNSYAAVVVKCMDHLITAKILMKEHLNEPHNDCCIERILNEFSGSLRASELFALWTPDLLRSVKNMANKTIESKGSRASDSDRDARVCLVIMDQTRAEESIKFVDVCRKKYPHEVLFQRIYVDLFTYTKNWDCGLKASEEVSRLFPSNADILNSRAGMLRITTDKGEIDYKNWSLQKKQIEAVKEAYKRYIELAPKDHRFFAENNYIMAFLSLKYSNPSSQISHSDLQDINVYFQNGLNAEMDILPCFHPFRSGAKEYVEKFVNVLPTTYIDITKHGMPGRPKTATFIADNTTFIDIRKPTKR